jgi:hypothetical protein
MLIDIEISGIGGKESGEILLVFIFLWMLFLFYESD